MLEMDYETGYKIVPLELASSRLLCSMFCRISKALERYRTIGACALRHLSLLPSCTFMMDEQPNKQALDMQKRVPCPTPFPSP